MKASRNISKIVACRSVSRHSFLAVLLLGATTVSAAAGTESLLLQEAAMAPLQEDIYTTAHATIIPMDDMQELRGGFSIGGVDMDFGATLQTKIDGMVRMKTQLAFTQAGINIVSQEVSGLSPGVTSVSPSANPVTQIAPDSFNLSGLASFSGLAMSDAESFTAALYKITRNAIVSAVVSNGSGQDISQSINIDIKVNNIGDIRSARERASFIRSLHNY
ncbi:hypothetical protein [Halomonas sp. YLGW01]|uniref:hypothetical protein n=1 Tax=Halomonas sp. YLGW01 TaxID=2773308 RepID=UPI00177E30C5|nr:hypothetical protein [Halomonas sp. YLGW01]